MSFPRYPAYKPSGVAWLGEVPAHWSLSRLGYICKKIGSGKTPSGGSDTYCADGVVFIRSQNVYDEGLFLDDVVCISAETDEEMAGTRVYGGDILLNITGASLGRTCVVPSEFVPANVNQHVCIIRLIDGPSRAFIAMAMKSEGTKSQINATQNGAAREGLNFAQVSKLVLPCPPPTEQALIAMFLEGETSKIDALIVEQEHLIALLAEKRRTVISNAVTKGLNPGAPMKNSGIEWLGNVPDHWEVAPLSTLAKNTSDSFVDGDWIETPFITSDGIRLLQTGNIGVGHYKEQGYRYISIDTFSRLRCTEVEPGDVLICRLADPVGRACIAPRLDCRMITSVDVCILKLHASMSANFVVYLLSSVQYLGYMEGQCRGGTRDRVSRSFLGSVRISFPPSKAEQLSIAAFLDWETTKLDALTTEAQHVIELLRERRAALISAAVTGQIDVRGAVEAAS